MIFLLFRPHQNLAVATVLVVVVVDDDAEKDDKRQMRRGMSMCFLTLYERTTLNLGLWRHYGRRAISSSL